MAFKKYTGKEKKFSDEMIIRKCSKCDYWTGNKSSCINYRYCPQCGSKMREVLSCKLT